MPNHKLSEEAVREQVAAYEEQLRAQVGASKRDVRHFKRPADPPFTADQRDRTTILFGGLTTTHDYVLEAAAEGLGYRVEALPEPDNVSLAIGKEYGNRGQCNPTYYTVGNLVKYLQELRRQGVEDIERRYVFVTAGACGPCRFGMYEAEYRKALQDAGFRDFRVLLFQTSGGLEDGGGLGEVDGKLESGLVLDAKFFLTLLRAMIASDIVNAMAHMIRPYEVDQGATDAALQQARDALRDSFRERRSTWRTLRRIRRIFDVVDVDYTRPKPKVVITGEFWAQTTEGEGSYYMQSWLESEGAELVPEPVGTWIDYLLENAIRKQKDRIGITPGARRRALTLRAGVTLYKLLYAAYRSALGFYTPPLVSQRKLAEVADEYYNVRAGGGEGHMEVGKHILATTDGKAHMVTSIKPFGCMPSTQSDGVQSKVVARLKESIFIPIETSGDGQVNVRSRVQMKLFEAKGKARDELRRALAEHDVTVPEVQEYVAQHPELRRPRQQLPHTYVGTASNFVAKVARQMGRKRILLAEPVLS